MKEERKLIGPCGQHQTNSINFIDCCLAAPLFFIKLIEEKKEGAAGKANKQTLLLFEWFIYENQKKKVWFAFLHSLFISSNQLFLSFNQRSWLNERERIDWWLQPTNEMNNWNLLSGRARGSSYKSKEWWGQPAKDNLIQSTNSSFQSWIWLNEKMNWLLIGSSLSCWGANPCCPNAPQANNPISFFHFSFSKRNELNEMEFAALSLAASRRSFNHKLKFILFLSICSFIPYFHNSRWQQEFN